jgi:hypothetical protein
LVELADRATAVWLAVRLDDLDAPIAVGVHPLNGSHPPNGILAD